MVSGRAGSAWLRSEPDGVQSGLLPAPPWSLGLVTGDSEDEASLVPFMQMPRPRGVQCEQCSLRTRLLGVSVWTLGSFKVGVTSAEAEGCQAGTETWLSCTATPPGSEANSSLCWVRGCPCPHLPPLPSTPAPGCHPRLLQANYTSPAWSPTSPPVLPAPSPHQASPARSASAPAPHSPGHLNSSMLASVNTSYLPGSLLTPGPFHGSSLCLEHFASLHLPFRSQPRLPP